MPNIEILSGDITAMQVDAIVCPAHKHLIRGRGLSAQIYDKIGDPLIKECSTLVECAVGEARLTSAYNLPANYIIHTVTPQWSGGDLWGTDSLAQLRCCYNSAIELALEAGVQSLAFPALSAGTNKFPMAMAAHLGLEVLLEHEDEFSHLVVCLLGEADKKLWQSTRNKAVVH